MSYEVDERGTHAVSPRGTGGAVFAAVLMIIAGALGSLQGIALIAKGDYYVQLATGSTPRRPPGAGGTSSSG